MKTIPNCARLALATGLLFAASKLKAVDEAGPGPAVDAKKSVRDIKPPRLIKRIDPHYPDAMAMAGLIGSVTLAFVIDQAGLVREPEVVRSNNPWFERPAIDAILRWKFEPGTLNGRTVNVRAEQTLEFILDDYNGEAPKLWRVSKHKDSDKLPPEFRWETPPMPEMTMFPVYPFEQLKDGVSGKASVSYVVGPDGEVIKASLREASSPEFGAAVLAMIEAWYFQPARNKDGAACYAMLGSEYEFRPKGWGDVPVSASARDILRTLEKRPGRIAGPSDLDMPIKPLSHRSPIHPTALLNSNSDGQALIEFFVDENGDAQLPRVISSSAPEFGYAAVQAVATWRFSVPLKKGKPVVLRVRVQVNFDSKPPAERKS